MKHVKKSEDFLVSQKSRNDFSRCPSCQEGTLTEVNDILNEIDGYIFIIKGKRCSSCGIEFMNEKEGQQMISVAKRLGVWGHPLKLHRKLSKSARGTILRIPIDIEENMGLKGTEDIAISKIGDRKLLIEIE